MDWTKGIGSLAGLAQQVASQVEKRIDKVLEIEETGAATADNGGGHGGGGGHEGGGGGGSGDNGEALQAGLGSGLSTSCQ